VAYCVHALREPTGDIVSPDMVPEGAELFKLLTGLTNLDA
jgi:hypothetical protein